MIQSLDLQINKQAYHVSETVVRPQLRWTTPIQL